MELAPQSPFLVLAIESRLVNHEMQGAAITVQHARRRQNEADTGECGSAGGRGGG